MAFNVSYVYGIVDRFSSKASNISRKVDSISSSFRKGQKALKSYGESITKIGKNLSLKITAPLVAIAALSLGVAADIETIQIAFESMTGSASKAKQLVTELVAFAAKTPFQLMGISKAAKQLLAAGVSSGELTRKLKFLGDIAAGANIPLSDMAAIFAKSKAKGKAMTEELLQLSDRGIPIIAVLAKMTGKSKDAIFDLASKGRISFALLERALISMSEKGGVFANQMEKQSATLSGVWSTFKDNVSLALGSIGEQIVKTFNLKVTINNVIGAIQRATAAFNAFAENNPRLAKLAVIMASVAAIMGPIAIAIGTLVAGLAALSGAAAAAGVTIGAIAAPVLIATGVIAGMAAIIGLLIAYWDDVKAITKNVIDFWGGGFFNGIKKATDLLREMGSVGEILAFVIDMAVAPAKAFVSVLNNIKNVAGGVIDTVKGFFGKEELTVRGIAPKTTNGNGIAAQSLQQSVRLDGSIEVNGAPGTVKSVQSKSTGPAVGNLGLNMAGM